MSDIFEKKILEYTRKNYSKAWKNTTHNSVQYNNALTISRDFHTYSAAENRKSSDRTLIVYLPNLKSVSFTNT